MMSKNDMPRQPDCPSASDLLHLLPGLVAYFGPDLRYRFVNEAYRRWRGISPDTIIGRYVRDIVGETNYPLIATKLREALGGASVTYEYDLFDREHARRVQGSYVPDLAPDGTVRGVLALITDISARHDLQMRVAESEAMFNDTFQNAPIGKAIVDLQGCLIRVNQTFATMLGRSMEELIGLNFSEVTHPEDLDVDLELFRSVIDKQRDGYRIEKRYVRPDGSIVYTKLAVSVARDSKGEAIRFSAYVEDVTEQYVAQRKLIATNARLSLVTESIRGGSWHMDVATGTFQTSEALACFVGGAGVQPYGLEGYVAHIHPEDAQGSDLTELVEGRVDRNTATYRLQTVTGTHWMRCDRRLLRDAAGRPEQIVGVTTDFTEEYERQLAAESQANTDPLTGLLNRRGLEHRLRRIDAGTPCGILAIDLDGFKQVNDRLGHAAGDEVLTEAAHRLRRMVRESDVVARFGGDEFVLVLVGADQSGLTAWAERATRALKQPFACEAAGLRVGASVGAAWSESRPDVIDGELSRADAALYSAKAAGRGTWRLAA